MLSTYPCNYLPAYLGQTKRERGRERERERERNTGGDDLHEAIFDSLINKLRYWAMH